MSLDKQKRVDQNFKIWIFAANIAYKIQEVPDELSTELPGNPVLYVTKIPSGKTSMTGWEDNEYYINNAKVISANHRWESDAGSYQVSLGME